MSLDELVHVSGQIAALLMIWASVGLLLALVASAAIWLVRQSLSRPPR